MATPDAYILLLDYFKDERFSYIERMCEAIERMEPAIAAETNLVQRELTRPQRYFKNLSC
jgi:hypothetical protein